MTAVAYRPPSLDPAVVRERNRLYRRVPPSRLRVGESEWAFMWTRWTETTEYGVGLFGRWGERRVFVGLRAGDAMAFLARGLGDDMAPTDLAVVPPAVQTAVVEAMLGLSLDFIEKVSGELLRVDRVAIPCPPPTQMGDTVGFRLTRTHDGATMEGDIAFEDDGRDGPRALASAVGLLTESPQPPPTSTPVRLSLEVGETRLPLDDAVSLAPGDILLLDRCLWRERKRVRFRLGRTAVAMGGFETESGQAHLMEAFRMDTPADNELSPAPDASGDAADSDSGAASSGPPLEPGRLEVHMILELDNRHVSLEDAQAMQPGYVVETDKDLDEPMTLRLNGLPVAVGELVEVGGRMGVRIVRRLANP